jgi:hypothetical protein
MTPSQSPHHLFDQAQGDPEYHRMGHEGERQGGQKQNQSFKKSELIALAFQLGFIIAIPVVVFGFLGKWLDGKAGTAPLLTLIGIFTAIVFTSIWIYRKFKRYFN